MLSYVCSWQNNLCSVQMYSDEVQTSRDTLQWKISHVDSLSDLKYGDEVFSVDYFVIYMHRSHRTKQAEILIFLKLLKATVPNIQRQSWPNSKYRRCHSSWTEQKEILSAFIPQKVANRRWILLIYLKCKAWSCINTICDINLNNVPVFGKQFDNKMIFNKIVPNLNC